MQNIKTYFNTKYFKNEFVLQAPHGRQTGRGHSVESASISLSSEGITAKYPSSPPHTRENSGFVDIFGKVDKVVNVQECLI